jgi:hypothetical protein
MAGLFAIPPHADKHLLILQYTAASSLLRNGSLKIAYQIKKDR